MQVTETQSQGLKRAYKVVVPVSDLSQKLNDQLNEMKSKAQIKGFRPGKVPLEHLRKLYGKQVMADVLQNAVNEANREIVEKNGLKLASEPQVDVEGGQEGVENAIEAKGDLAFTVNVEVLPKFEVGAFDDIALERPVVAVAETEIDDTLQRMADQGRPFAPKDGAAAKGDKVTIDFVGKVDGEAFEGGSGTDMDVVLGANQFIPGFEEQLEGVKTGEARVLNVSFPAEYGAAHLAGKAATFDIVAKAVQAPGEVAIDDEFAKKFGLEGVDKLRDAIRADIQRQFDRASREKVKRSLLDALDKRYSFELPQTLVDQEFNNIWQQVQTERQQSGRSFEDEGTTEEAAQADYRKIAERRVRLGLVMAQVGENEKVEISDDELTAGIVERARQYPGQEKAIWDYYRKNPQAVAQIRAPLYEEKVVDLILGKAKVADKTVTREELLRPDDEDAAA